MKERAEANYLKAVELTSAHPIFYEKLVKYYLNISNVDQAKVLFEKELLNFNFSSLNPYQNKFNLNKNSIRSSIEKR